jgi:hypothetical protein
VGVDIDVIVDADPAQRPLAIFVRLARHRLERRAIDLLKRHRHVNEFGLSAVATSRAGLNRAVGERKRENFLSRPSGAHDRRAEIERRALFIDHGRASNAER